MSEDDYEVTPERFITMVEPRLDALHYERAERIFYYLWDHFDHKWCYHLANALLQAANTGPERVERLLRQIEDEIQWGKEFFPEATFTDLEESPVDPYPDDDEEEGETT